MKKSTERTDPIDSKKKVEETDDPKLDQDFEGYPHGPAKDETIQPKTESEKKTAQTNRNPSEK